MIHIKCHKNVIILKSILFLSLYIFALQCCSSFQNQKLKTLWRILITPWYALLQYPCVCFFDFVIIFWQSLLPHLQSSWPCVQAGEFIFVQMHRDRFQRWTGSSLPSTVQALTALNVLLSQGCHRRHCCCLGFYCHHCHCQSGPGF